MSDSSPVNLPASAPNTSKTPMVLSRLLVGIEDLVNSLGGDVGALLDSCGIPAQVLDSTEQLVSHRAFVELLEQGALQCSCPTFSIELAKRQGEDNSSTFIQLLKSAPNLQTMEKLSQDYWHFYGEVTYWDIAVDGDYTTVIRRSNFPIDQHCTQYRLFLAAKSYLFLTSLFSEGW